MVTFGGGSKGSPTPKSSKNPELHVISSLIIFSPSPSKFLYIFVFLNPSSASAPDHIYVSQKYEIQKGIFRFTKNGFLDPTKKGKKDNLMLKRMHSFSFLCWTFFQGDNK